MLPRILSLIPWLARARSFVPAGFDAAAATTTREPTTAKVSFHTRGVEYFAALRREREARPELHSDYVPEWATPEKK